MLESVFINEASDWILFAAGAFPFLSAYGYKALKILTLTIKTGRGVLKEISAAYEEAHDIWTESAPDVEKEHLKTQLEEVIAETDVLQAELLAAREQISRLHRPSSIPTPEVATTVPDPVVIHSTEPDPVSAAADKWLTEKKGPVAAAPSPITVRVTPEGLDRVPSEEETHALEGNEGDDLPVSLEEYTALKAAFPNGPTDADIAALRAFEMAREHDGKATMEEWEKLGEMKEG